MKNSHLATLIKSKREKTDLKQAHLAALLGISRNHMNEIESGKVYPSVELLVMIFKELGYELTVRRIRKAKAV